MTYLLRLDRVGMDRIQNRIECAARDALVDQRFRSSAASDTASRTRQALANALRTLPSGSARARTASAR